MATVLVVDDRHTNRELVRTLLGYQGHQVIEAGEGGEALRLAREEHPDLVLTDIMMPGMDGWELARELRAAPDTATTPIVFLTAAYLEDETRPFVEACGVSRMLPRSADPPTLMQVVTEVLAEGRPAEPVDIARVDQERFRAISAKLFAKTKALSDTEARFRLMATSSPVGIVFGNEHGSATYANARLTEITRLATDDLLGLGWLGCAGEEYRDEILRISRGLGPRDVEHRYRSRIAMPDESSRWVNIHVQAVLDSDGEHAGFIGTIDDVTSLVEADQQSRAAERQGDLDARDRATERLDSLSTLAGGVGHDFNNILGSIMAFQAFVAESIEELTGTGQLPPETGRDLLSDLAQIRKGGERAIGLTQQLLAFGSRRIINRSALDLNQAVRESNDLLAPRIGSHVQLVTHLAADLRPVLAEPTNIAQILLNLTLNAAQAMPDGGTLTIVTSNVEITGEHRNAGPTPPTPGHYARLTIRDTGQGMTPETLQRAVEPFFTTKGRGLGTGLGLATVYGISNQLGGVLRLESTVGRGAVVTIHLPTTDEPVQQPAPPRRAADCEGTETVLVAEDEDGIREALTRALTTAGYTVLAASDGAAALAVADHHPQAVDLLLTDVVMPGMLGNELAAGLLERRPGTKVLFMSGYAGDLMNRYGVLEAQATVLPKPFTSDELLAAVRAAIDVSAT
ncbi:MAG TPA: response regulator [Actinoplanes sp.]